MNSLYSTSKWIYNGGGGWDLLALIWSGIHIILASSLASQKYADPDLNVKILAKTSREITLIAIVNPFK